jgi:hypothetical protein
MKILGFAEFLSINEAKAKTRGQAYDAVYHVIDDDEDKRQQVYDKLTNDDTSTDADLISQFEDELSISAADAKKLVDVRGWFAQNSAADQLRLSKVLHDKSKITELAKAFSEILQKEIGDDNIQQAAKLNLKEKSSGICHSHDYCDANMVMAEAMDKVLGVNMEKDYPDMIQNETIVGIWNAAWSEAHKHGFYVGKNN